MNRQKGFTLIELLVVVAIIGILSGIAFVSIQGARESAFDTQIRSELSQIRSNAEQYYYSEGEGTYHDYYTHSGWVNLQAELPACSIAIIDQNSDIESDMDNFPEGEDIHEVYQMYIEDDNDQYAQAYAAWAPLCAEEHDGAHENQVFYCADSDGNAGEYFMSDGSSFADINTDEANCLDVFENEL